MRKVSALLITLVILVLMVAPAAAQESYPVSEDFAVRQSADAGDPYSYTLLVVQESLNNSVEKTAFLVDPLQLLNLEHPEGFDGTIFGTFVIFNPNQDLEDVMAEIAQYVDNVVFMVYVGNQELPANSGWASEYTGNFWSVDLRINTETPINIEGSEWEWPSIPLSDDPVVCDDDTTCLYQAWDGRNARVVYHIVIEGGEEFVPFKDLQGTLFVVSNVEALDLDLLYSRFEQMSEEVLIRDENEDSDMVIHQLWVGENSQEPWTPVSDFDMNVAGTCQLTAQVQGLNVRASTEANATVITTLDMNETVDVVQVLPSGWVELEDGFVSPAANFSLDGCDS